MINYFHKKSLQLKKVFKEPTLHKMFFILLYFFTFSAAQTLSIIPPQSAYDSSHHYFSTLLQMVLDKTQDEYGKTTLVHSYQMEQGRAFAELRQEEHLDVYWAGTSIRREKNFHAIKVPLLKGLLGYRAFIIHKKNLKAFESLKSFNELKNFSACQGTHWPDATILEHAGIFVIKNPKYELMFKQVAKGRCDYFPRGVHEINSEMKVRKQQYPELIIYKKHLLYYPFPMYFFVNKNNTTLAKRLEKGLMQMLKDGSFDALLEKHPITKHLFPLQTWMHQPTFKLENPLLSKQTNITNKHLWIQSD